MTDLLKDYARRIGIDSLSLTDLIESHCSLREERKKFQAEWQTELQNGREYGRAQAEREVRELGWFSAERLRSMTLSELAELIRVD
ncbi:hypothetical protein F6X40_09310 [Paraburkholderia sp. UCT31]|uniref:hypothetical protein n=1 Tax=Paraburkholderia sp. UCT31 TaxID=2615209 RepID=UPI0016565A45|nr:hypothetical protein [Paraburkholderia sp. UCT31]MBC8737005.1 hypothetical protein [Paraburkholderia sp. UCT31]